MRKTQSVIEDIEGSFKKNLSLVMPNTLLAKKSKDSFE